jgi:hypothetical protein
MTDEKLIIIANREKNGKVSENRRGKCGDEPPKQHHQIVDGGRK